MVGCVDLNGLIVGMIDGGAVTLGPRGPSHVMAGFPDLWGLLFNFLFILLNLIEVVVGVILVVARGSCLLLLHILMLMDRLVRG